MARLQTLCCCLLLTSSWGYATAEEPPLVWQFRVGDEHRYRMTQKMDMEMLLGAADRQVETSIQQILDLTWRIEHIDDQGQATILQTIDRLQMDMQAPGQQAMHYDTAADKSPSGFAAMLVPLFKALTDEPFKISISPRGEIVGVEIPERVAKAMQSIPGAAMMGEMLTDEGLSNMIQKSSLVLPKPADLQPGLEWTRKIEMSNAQLGAIHSTTTYRYLGARQVEGESYEAFHISMDRIFGEGHGGALMELVNQKSDGEILFSRAAGRLESSKLQQEIELRTASGDRGTTQKMVQHTTFERIETKTEPIQ